MEDINVQVIDMDVMIPEQVVKNHDGSYTIFLNARYSYEYMLKSYQHALEHIQNGDFDKDYGDVQEIEAAAHEEKSILAVPNPLPAPASDPVVTVAENIKQPPKRRRRRRNRKQERYSMDRAEFIMEYCNPFALAEHQFLYGKDL